MTGRQKPFPYDAVETADAVLFIIDYQGADGRPAVDFTLNARGAQITRADGVTIRMIHLHPRLIETLQQKPAYVIEVGQGGAHAYATEPKAPSPTSLTSLFPPYFYWYIGPETAGLEDVARRPLARLLRNVLSQAVAVAPGEHVSGPLIGLCLSRPRVIALARGRSWARACSSVVVDVGLADGTTAGFPANDNIAESVQAAHADDAPLLTRRDRTSWSSQLAIAFKAS